METLLKIFKDYINYYNNTEDRLKKSLIAYDLYHLYYTSIMYFENTIYSDKIVNLYNELYNDETFNYFTNLGRKNTLKIYKKDSISEEDIDFLFNLIKDIKRFDVSKTKKYRYGYNLVKKYIDSDQDFNNIISYFDTKTIYGKNLDTSCVIRLLNDDILMLNTYNSVILMHELTHKYSDTKNVYSETLSLMSEFGIESKYGLGDICNRICYMLYGIPKILLYFNEASSIKFHDDITYYVGIIIGLAFVYNNGNDFKTLKSGMDIIKNNKHRSLEKNLQELNISKNDIVSSFEHSSKILVYK